MDTIVAGTRYRKSLGVRNRHAAQVREAEIIRKLELQAAGLPVESETADAKPTKLVNEYEAELQRRGSSIVHTLRERGRESLVLALDHLYVDAQIDRLHKDERSLIS